MTLRNLYPSLLLFAGTSLLASTALDWPQFRGRDGQGHAEAVDLPTMWDEVRHVRVVAAALPRYERRAHVRAAPTAGLQWRGADDQRIVSNLIVS